MIRGRESRVIRGWALLDLVVTALLAVPPVALMSSEEGYVLYFCGRSCQEAWATDQMALRMQEAGEP